MTGRTKPFAGFEFLIAWRYLRARRATGGVSVMTWISFLGIALAVAALIATLSVRSGFRHEFVGIILGANPHLEVLATPQVNEAGQIVRELSNYDAIAADLRGRDGIEQAAPVVQGQVMASGNGRNAGVQVTGIGAEDLARIPLIAEPEMAGGDSGRFDEGVAVGSRIARALGLQVGDPIRLISPEGARTPFGVSPRVGSFEVTNIFQVGRYAIDATRIYMPLAEAQTYFNRDGVVDAVEVTVADPERVNALALPVLSAVEDRVIIETWQDSSGAYLQALTMEDNVMFIILSILVLIAALNIVSGLIMLVKNKSRDIGILRTMGLSEGSILRVFFICGASVGLAGTAVGVALGCAFAIWIDPIFEFVNFLAGGGVWDPSIRFLSALPARLEWGDVGSAMALSLGLSFLVTIFPARRAARMNPVEALRYE